MELQKEVSKLIEEGMAKQKAGQVVEAIDLINQAIAIDPGNAEIQAKLGDIFLRQEKFSEAAAAYQKALALMPNYIKAMNNLAIVFVKQNKLAEAIELFEKIIALKPEFSLAYYSLAEIYYDQDNLQAVKTIYLRLLKVCQNESEAYNGLASICHELGEIEQAEALYKKIISEFPEHMAGYEQFGKFLQSQHRYDEATAIFKTLIERNYELDENYESLASVYQNKGDKEQAKTFYQKAADLGNKNAAYQVKLLAGEAVAHLPAGDVVEIFDNYADDFESHLVHELKYRTPELLFSTLQSACGIDMQFKSAIDLGCGTGLMGLLIRKSVSSLVGVDLSAKMLEKAAEKQVYDQLQVGDIVQFLNSTPTKYDLFVSVDVLIYCGDLEDIFKAIVQTASPAAHFAFSVEDTEREPYFLQPSGRYAYAHGYIQMLAQRHGFAIVLHTQTNLRLECNEWVKGNIYILRKQF